MPEGIPAHAEGIDDQGGQREQHNQRQIKHGKPERKCESGQGAGGA